jgi:predicted nucleotidyltransferase
MIMINERDKEIITRCAKKYKVSSIYLFGSSLDRDTEPNDIDLAVEGIRPEVFFKFYGELLRSLSKPVDLVDLSRKSLFNRIIEEKGVKIYG